MYPSSLFIRGSGFSLFFLFFGMNILIHTLPPILLPRQNHRRPVSGPRRFRGKPYCSQQDFHEYQNHSHSHSQAPIFCQNVLFSGTILDNLRWGDENASEEDCIEACRQACADEFIERMPDKYNTWIEQGGSNVSGGQRQRLCIARALLKRHLIVLNKIFMSIKTTHTAILKHQYSVCVLNT